MLKRPMLVGLFIAAMTCWPRPASLPHRLSVVQSDQEKSGLMDHRFPSPGGQEQRTDQAKNGAGTEPGKMLLEQVRRQVLDLASQLPDFVVGQKIYRYFGVRKTGPWFALDDLELELTYETGKGEQTRLVKHNGKATSEAYSKLHGALSFGVFSSVLAPLFKTAAKTEFALMEHKRFHGHDAVIYSFSVAQSNSRLSIGVNGSGQSIYVAYGGRIWVDPSAKQVMRIEEASEVLPESSKANYEQVTVEYGWARVGAEKLMLPVSAEIVLGERRAHGDDYFRSVIKFSNYHKFGGEIRLAPAPPQSPNE